MIEEILQLKFCSPIIYNYIFLMKTEIMKAKIEVKID